MPRARPVHRLSAEEAALTVAIADERRGEGERARNLRLKATIEEFWRGRGYAVTVELVEGGFHPSVRETRIELRSQMKNGLPIGEQKP